MIRLRNKSLALHIFQKKGRFQQCSVIRILLVFKYALQKAELVFCGVLKKQKKVDNIN